ncbi:hypothetical protein ENSA7_15500 [Enhygromyxa salina]|uniref:Uncharacterized protein n=1 Tax=Enhygromyxa salina TaxID=215803 RepID=A0A2S9YUM0_9BACT|nr:hypothetical protein ENSA7_15500 [Enhygromyxa salina]
MQCQRTSDNEHVVRALCPRGWTAYLLLSILAIICGCKTWWQNSRDVWPSKHGRLAGPL